MAIPVTNSGLPVVLSPSRSDLLRQQSQELIFVENPERWVLLPIEYPSLWEFYKKIETSFWTPEDFNWKNEGDVLKNEAKLSENALRWLLDWSACYNLMYGVPGGCEEAASFPDVLDLSCEFVESIQTPEGRAYLGFQSLFENFHREVFTRFIQTFIPSDDDPRLQALYKSNYMRRSLQAKHSWLLHHMIGFHSESKKKRLAGDIDSSHIVQSPTPQETSPMAEVLMALMVFKGYFFSSLFLIQYMCRSVKEASFQKASRQVSHDLLLHADFAAHIYSSLEHKIDLACLKTMLVQAMELEFNFIMEIVGSEQVELNCTVSDIGSLLRGLVVRSLRSLGYHDDRDLQLPSSSLPGEASGSMLIKELSIPSYFQVVHKGPFKVVPPEKQAQPVTVSTDLEFNEDF